MIWIVIGAFIGAVTAAMTFLVWACLSCGAKSDELAEYERRLRGD